MFCIFCGKELPEHARFCSGCGKSQSNDITLEKQQAPPSRNHPTLPLVLTILLSILCSRTVICCIFQNGAIPAWRLIPGVIMLILLITMCITRRIRPDKIGWDCLLIPIAIAILSAGRQFCLASSVDLLGYFSGSNIQHAMLIVRESVYRAPCAEGWEVVWQWGLILIFLLIRSETIPFHKKHSIIIIGILSVCSVVTALFAPYLTNEFCRSLLFEWQRITEDTIPLLRSFFIAGWLQNLILYFFIILTAKRKSGYVRTVLFPIITSIASFFFLLFCLAGLEHPWIMFYMMDMGYLTGLLVLLTVYIPKIKKKEVRRCSP